MKLPRSSLCPLWCSLLLGVGSSSFSLHSQHLTNSVSQTNSGGRVSEAPGRASPKVQMAPQHHSSAEAPAISWHTDDIPAGRFPGSPPILRRCCDSSLGNKSSTKRQRKSSRSALSGRPEVQQQSRMSESRRRSLNDFCADYRPVPRMRRLRSQQVSQIYVEDRFQLLYCEVPKVGCSNWKRVSMVSGGRARSTQDIPHDAAHYSNQLRRSDSYDRAGIAERSRSYTKVSFVREPFERLVSAFRDKFESPNSYYHPVFGRAIISRYRVNATGSASKTGAGVTFREFVQYSSDVQKPVGMDIHWERVGQLCSPCSIQYNFIGKFESLQEDADFSSRSIGAPNNLTFPDFKDRNPSAERTSSRITSEYFSQSNSTERQKVFEFYLRDYSMFSYPKPFPDSR